MKEQIQLQLKTSIQLKAYYGKALLKVATNFLHPEMPLSVFG